MKKEIHIIFGALVVLVVVLLSEIFGVELVRDFFGGMFFVVIVGILVLGGALFYLVKKSKLKNPERRYLLLTGGSSIGVFVSIILHNLVSAVVMAIFGGVEVIEEPVFFLLGVIGFPILFMVGVVGSTYFMIKNN